jgi:hypothetical protein
VTREGEGGRGEVGRRGVGGLRGRRGEVGPRGPKGEGGRGLGCCFFSFFSKPFQIFFKPFLNSNLLHKFSQLYFTIIFKNFHKYFKTFKTTPQPKLMHSNHDAQALIASKLLK